MTRFVVLLGGDMAPMPGVASLLADARVIAADSGIRHATTFDLRPELWVGDFDSVTPDLLETFADIPREIFPREKDATDGELAIAAALERGATELVLAGAFGGVRLDHTFLHMTQAIRFTEAGTPTMLVSGDQNAFVLTASQRHSFSLPDGTLFSVLPFTELSGLTITGARWPLDAVEVPFGSSLTLSNEVEGDLAVTLTRGRAILITHHLDARCSRSELEV